MKPPRDIDLLQLVFSGETVQGRDPQAVRATAVAALKLDQARAARLFSGKRVVLRRAADVTMAHRYMARFAMRGAARRRLRWRRRRRVAACRHPSSTPTCRRT